MNSIEELETKTDAYIGEHLTVMECAFLNGSDLDVILRNVSNDNQTNHEFELLRRRLIDKGGRPSTRLGEPIVHEFLLGGDR